VWHKHWRNVKVINPAVHMGLRPDTTVDEDRVMADLLARWGEDPIHPTSAAYDQLAKALMAMAADAQPATTAPSVRLAIKRVASPGPTTDNRPQWVRHASNEVVASGFKDRRDRAGPSGNAGQSGSWRSSGNPRGNAGSRGHQRSPRHLSGNAGGRGAQDGDGYGGPSGNAGRRMSDGYGGPSGNAGRHLPEGKRFRRGH